MAIKTLCMRVWMWTSGILYGPFQDFFYFEISGLGVDDCHPRIRNALKTVQFISKLKPSVHTKQFDNFTLSSYKLQYSTTYKVQCQLGLHHRTFNDNNEEQYQMKKIHQKHVEDKACISRW